ncbi:hypothetical protein [Streptomyces nitrosporeus]|uniref:hypothetical protein n=1 Tax=Streptomyces nitrosporeus TaxID=28894 RepID=UPI00142EFA2F|nr:hypothetical protein [Streptomyces nitrosporeus]GGY99392.1 hypothetical protein GCM10010327_32510 [Streptomyces nitrosporeus]
MNRTRMLSRVFSAEACEPGEIVIAADRFTHGSRERVVCAHSDLLRGSVERSGLRAVVREMRVSPAAIGGLDGAGMAGWALSYELDPAHCVGFAAFAHAEDVRGAEVAADAIAEWSRALRTRVLVREGAGAVCTGTRRLLETVARQSDGSGERVVVYGAQGCGRAAVKEIHRLGGRLGGEGVAPKPGDVAVVGPLPLRGEERVVTEAGAPVPVVDATCERYRAAADEIGRLSGQGGHVVLAAPGREGAAVESLGEAVAGRLTVVSDPGGAESVPVPAPGAVGVVLVPGRAVRPSLAVEGSLRTRFGHVIPQRPATYCWEADDRRDSVRSVAAVVDLLLVATDAADQELDDILSWVPSGTPVRAVGALRDLEPGWLRSVGPVGVVATSNAPPQLAEELLTGLRLLGPTDTVLRSVSTTRVG